MNKSSPAALLSDATMILRPRPTDFGEYSVRVYRAFGRSGEHMLKKVFGGEIMHSAGGGADRRGIERVCRCHVYLPLNDGEALKEERRSGAGDGRDYHARPPSLPRSVPAPRFDKDRRPNPGHWDV